MLQVVADASTDIGTNDDDGDSVGSIVDDANDTINNSTCTVTTICLDTTTLIIIIIIIIMTSVYMLRYIDRYR